MEYGKEGGVSETNGKNKKNHGEERKKYVPNNFLSTLVSEYWVGKEMGEGLSIS